VSNPGDNYWHALERILRYLKGTMSYDIHYTGYPKVLEGFYDANWISDTDELYAISGYVFFLGGGVVSWKSCKQTVLMKSTMEAELTALDTVGAEAEWLRETKVNSSKDNMKSTRHIKQRLKSIRKLRNSGVIALDYVHTSKNLADNSLRDCHVK
jgi:hypothetical protein